MPQSLSDIRRAYDLASNAYAETFINELDYKPLDVELLKEFASRVGNGQSVLDLGCGPGHTTAYLESLGLVPTGIDLSPNMLTNAKSRFPNVEFQVGDLKDLSVGENSIKGILEFYCIVHMQSDELIDTFKEMFRVLSVNGILLVSFHVGTEPVHQEDFLDSGAVLDFFPFPVQVVQSALLASGFSNLETHTRQPYDQEYPSERSYIFAIKPNV